MKRNATSAAVVAVLIPTIFALIGLSITTSASAVEDVFDRVKHGYADSAGVKIHYAMLGPTSGSANAPLVVMIHGFPDFWYSWRHQMAALSKDYQVVAIDQRGYNLSDKPKGKENYDMSLLVEDLRAVVKHLGRDKAVIVGHDWGGRVAWGFAMKYPEMTHRFSDDEVLARCAIIEAVETGLDPNPIGVAREANVPHDAMHDSYIEKRG